MMSPLVLLLAFVLVGDVRAIVELDCNDNATCIEQIPKQLIVNLRQKKAVKIFDLITIEPLATRQARSSQDLWTRFLENHAVSFDLLDYTFQITPREDNTNALNFEVFESRTAKDVSDQTSKKSSSKAEEDKEEDKSPKLVIKRKHKKKVMQVLIPMLFGMKSAGAVIFAFTVVAMLTIKAFIASKLALMVTVGMALKKLYDSYGVGVGLQNHPYLYSQYPIDFPSASSHAYSMNGVSPQFASPDIYNPTGLGQSNVHDILQHDANAQPSQQAPTLQLINGTRAAERWDGYRRRPMFYGSSRTTSESFSGYQPSQ